MEQTIYRSPHHNCFKLSEFWNQTILHVLLPWQPGNLCITCKSTHIECALISPNHFPIISDWSIMNVMHLCKLFHFCRDRKEWLNMYNVTMIVFISKSVTKGPFWYMNAKLFCDLSERFTLINLWYCCMLNQLNMNWRGKNSRMPNAWTVRSR